MKLGRSVVAFIMLIVFAPASVLAAAPLELCLGFDGHRAIESALTNDHHGAEFDSASAKSLALVAVQSSDCRDAPLIAESARSVRSDISYLTNASSQGDIAMVCTPVRATPAQPRSAEFKRHFAPPNPGDDPRLVARRTVVLLN